MFNVIRLPISVTFLLFFFLPFSCVETRADSIEQVFGVGWTCSLVPNSIYGPGAIYELGPTGKKFLGDTSGEAGFQKISGTATVGKFTETREIGSDINISLLEKLIKGAKAALTGSVDSTSHSSIEYVIDSYVVTPLRSVYISRQWMTRNVKPESRKRYFLIREAISVKSIAYEMSQELVGKLGGEVPVKNVLNAKLTLVKGENNSRYNLVQIINPALWACNSVDELKPEGSIVGEVNWTAEHAIPSRSDVDDLSTP
jgi:hypothetical protein